jgi:hypothetical protein
MRAAFGFGFGLPLGGSGDAPAIDWNFAGGVMPSALTFSRASTATYYNAAGTLVTAASGSPRLTYDPVTHSALGLLVEEQRTNLLTYSEALDNAAWVKNGGASITANVSTAPDGTVTADRLTVVTGASDSLESPGVSITSGTAYTATARLLLGTSATVTLNMSNAAAWSGGVNPSATVNLSTGAITGVAANTTAKVETLPGGWFAVSITATAAATTTSSLRVVPVSSASTTSVWGLQLEAGAFATSYIPTGAASATRAADVVTCSGSAFSQWFNAAGGTVVVDFLAPPGLVPSTYPRVWEFQDAADSSLLGIWVNGGGSIRVGVYTAGAWQEINLGAATAGGRYKVALRYGASGIAVCCNGGAVATNASTITWANIAKCSIGQSIGQQWLNAPIRRALAYRRELTNAQMQALTA